ncbi:glycosyltransferase family 2 protein [Paenibacillus sp. FSL H8-0261]|uniref:glycosyltransferase family 2 protein n=1 Tax=Paenibacillus sp. FSL H8-0261 TaxID=2921381 RepID=UPI00324DDC57
MNNLISVIIVNYNGADYIGESIESIIDQTYTNLEIIVLDNNSSDDSVQKIKQYPSVKLIESKTNLGFAKGNNVAIREANGEYIALLNNDATAEASWLESLAKVLDHNDEYGSCGCKIISYYEQDYLDSAGLLINPSGMSRARGRNESIHDYNISEPILIPSGCAVLYRKKALDEVGLFDEDFFCYCEDTDLGFRLQISGWKCFYVSEAVVYHRYSSTAGKYSLFKTYLVERNHYWFVIKNFPLSLVLMNPMYTIRLYLYQLLNMFKQKGATNELMTNTSTKKLVLTLLKAHKDVWKMLFVMLKKRSINNKLKKVDNRQIKEWIKQYNISVADLFKS